ncbi:P-loop containing nucleoside triphosphate hydrolase [Gemmata obscuriglobus]|uniref:ABC transporter ATP-binding protein n=1 Tax=Gemmata obscuriglobus TaxID=114 RepID=A0A2Z3HBI4_9BACT|nr:ABC transporter ATP-binding protein [Gemmata obscuriglobus]AWM40897.1 ABC transporter ATP-binding protein [Gemmata obscuriglobus]QEG25803.1 P-loop containing nucleoside triphosphate hydrolase [Gemmata obscuriglobus]VTR99688.1 lipoprotein releasing system atp-binding protein : Lipoprotein-releasing system ATP-binding protein LolD OS=Planctomyces limnophilus (strain ATCC 43296 / DSM 3776 / IFAM 1008 / 290) GN=lolD PE=3 SV=1: ABC_tran [Gemmata obscuriglobus UQM 2246]
MLIAENLQKTYRRHAVEVPVLTRLNLEVRTGEFLSIIGASGSGKSTLLHLLGTLDEPDGGRVLLDGKRIDNLPSRARDRLRNETFGYIFQFYHLLPELTALDNVLMPAYISNSTLGWWRNRARLRHRAEELLEKMGLGHRLKHRPRELSGGEMQRTAIARALLMRPRVLLADEPTGNLDAKAGGEIVHLLRQINREEKVTIVMVTHNTEIVSETDRVVRMAGGMMIEEAPPQPRGPFHPRLAAV